MAVTKDELESFNRFAEEQIQNGGADISFDELVSQWRASREREEVNDAIRQSLDDIEAGRTSPFDESMDDMRKKYNIPDDA